MFRGSVRVFFFGFGFLGFFFPFNTSYRPIQQYEYIDLVLSATSIEAAVLPFRVVWKREEKVSARVQNEN